MDRKKLIGTIVDRLHIIHQNVKSDRMERSRHGGCLPITGCITLHLIDKSHKITIKKIAELLGVTGSAATQIVNELQAAGLIQKTQNPNDKRSFILTKTPAGQKMSDRMCEEMIVDFEPVFANLTDTELQTYAALTEKMSNK